MHGQSSRQNGSLNLCRRLGNRSKVTKKADFKAGQFVRRSGRGSFAVAGPLQRAGGQVGELSGKFTTPHKTGGLKEQAQNEQGQGHHENGDLSVGLLGDIGCPCGRDTGKKRHRDCSDGKKAEKGE